MITTPRFHIHNLDAFRHTTKVLMSVIICKTVGSGGMSTCTTRTHPNLTWKKQKGWRVGSVVEHLPRMFSLQQLETRFVGWVEGTPDFSPLLDSVCDYLHRGEEWPAGEEHKFEISSHRHLFIDIIAPFPFLVQSCEKEENKPF